MALYDLFFLRQTYGKPMANLLQCGLSLSLVGVQLCAWSIKTVLSQWGRLLPTANIWQAYGKPTAAYGSLRQDMASSAGSWCKARERNSEASHCSKW